MFHGAYYTIYGGMVEMGAATLSRKMRAAVAVADAGVSEVSYYDDRAHARSIGVDFAPWAKKLCQIAEESFNGLKRESATD